MASNPSSDTHMSLKRCPGLKAEALHFLFHLCGSLAANAAELISCIDGPGEEGPAFDEARLGISRGPCCNVYPALGALPCYMCIRLVVQWFEAIFVMFFFDEIRCAQRTWRSGHSIEPPSGNTGLGAHFSTPLRPK